MEHLLEVKNLSVSIDGPSGEVQAVRDVTGKNCPKYYVENPDAWIQMKSDIAVQIDVDYGLQDVQ